MFVVEPPLASGRNGVGTGCVQASSQKIGGWLQPGAQFVTNLFLRAAVTGCAYATNIDGRQLERD
jgi:hypothetical protein